MLAFFWQINTFALRKARIVHNFGLSECNRVKEGLNDYNYTQLTNFMAVGVTMNPLHRVLFLFVKEQMAVYLCVM